MIKDALAATGLTVFFAVLSILISEPSSAIDLTTIYFILLIYFRGMPGKPWK